MGVIDWVLIVVLSVWTVAAVLYLVHARKKGKTCCGNSDCSDCKNCPQCDKDHCFSCGKIDDRKKTI